MHHHTPNHPSAWSPDRQLDHLVDAQFLAHVALLLVLDIANEYVYDEKVIEHYQDYLRAHLAKIQRDRT